jgi:hypothetical protein
VTGDGADVVVLHALLDAIAPPSSIDDRAFEEEIWTECAHAIAARQATFLAPLLHFFGLMFCQVPDRLPAAVDDPLSIALGIILADTEMTSPAKHLQYDPYLVRYYSAFLARAMHRRGRGDLAIQAAWIGAIQSDPLPDTRRARENAEMIIARSDTGELDAG